MCALTVRLLPSSPQLRLALLRHFSEMIQQLTCTMMADAPDGLHAGGFRFTGYAGAGFKQPGVVRC